MTIRVRVQGPSGPATDYDLDGPEIVINGALGTGPPADVNGDSITDAVDVQLVINAALGL